MWIVLTVVALGVLSATLAVPPAEPPRVNNNATPAHLQPRFRHLYRNGIRITGVGVDQHQQQLEAPHPDYNRIQAAFPLYPVTMFDVQPSSKSDLSQARTPRRKRSTLFSSRTGSRMYGGRTGSRIAVVRSSRYGFSSRQLNNRYNGHGGILGGRGVTDMFGSRRLSQLRKQRRFGLGRRSSSFYPSRQFDW